VLQEVATRRRRIVCLVRHSVSRTVREDATVEDLAVAEQEAKKSRAYVVCLFSVAFSSYSMPEQLRDDFSERHRERTVRGG
jgi:hypothetical protein